jgi:FMN-dependent NADH-azoreductase
MKKLLHIIATPRGEESRTLKVAESFLEAFLPGHLDWVIDKLDLSGEALPSLTAKRVDGKYVLLAGKDLFGEQKQAWEEIVLHIERFLSADAYLFSTPMWNFTIPYTLKHYLDVIIQPEFLFRYTPDGVEGLVRGRKAAVIVSRGGQYSTEATRGYDFQDPYLRMILEWIGISDVTFVVADGMDMGEKTLSQNLMEAQAKARALGEMF